MRQANGLKTSMRLRGNCHVNACAESFFSLLKKEWIRRRTYLTRGTAKSDVFNYIQLLYNPNGFMKIVAIGHPWSLKTTILGTKRVSKNWVRVNKPTGLIVTTTSVFESLKIKLIVSSVFTKKPKLNLFDLARYIYAV